MTEAPLLILDADHKPVRENIELLGSTLQKGKYRNLPMKIVSATGVMRCGKSTTLNLFMRQLRAHEKTRQSIDKLDASLKSNTDLDGFPWGGGTKAVTHGVYIWSRPFIVSDGNGDKSAVLLMDVEGAFDGATVEESAPVFVFAALVSSAVLLNVDRIDEFVIQLLGYFVATGNALLQDVILVVRNFSLAQTLGFEPGNKLLEEKMEVIDSMNEAKRTSRERIRQFALNLSCLLMPNPGQQAAEQSIWNDARPEFLSCTSDLLRAAIRRSKLVEEEPLTCADFVAFMESLFPAIASDQHLYTMPFLEVVRVNTSLMALRLAEYTYRRKICTLANKIGLKDAHEQLQRDATESLQCVLSPEVRKQLTTDLEERLKEIKNATNENMRRETRRKMGTGVAVAVGAVAIAVTVPVAIIVVPAIGATVPATLIGPPVLAAAAPVAADATAMIVGAVATVATAAAVVGTAVGKTVEATVGVAIGKTTQTRRQKETIGTAANPYSAMPDIAQENNKTSWESNQQ